MTGISFDLSRKSSGWAYWRDEQPIKVGTIGLPEGFLGEQLSIWEGQLGVYSEVGALLHSRTIDWVAFEDARAVSKQHGMILFGMTGMLHALCWDLGIPVFGYTQSTIKKVLTGWGRSDKEQMVAAAKERWPHLEIETDDQADALGVGLAFFAHQKS